MRKIKLVLAMSILAMSLAGCKGSIDEGTDTEVKAVVEMVDGESHYELVYREKLTVEELEMKILYYRDKVTNLMHYVAIYDGASSNSFSMAPYYRNAGYVCTYEEFKDLMGIKYE